MTPGFQANPPEKSVLITGASTGIGLACAHRLATRGWRVFAGVRKLEGWAEIPGVTALHLDVTRAESIARATELIDAQIGPAGLSAVINNAGIAVGGPIECVAGPELARQLEVNVLGPAAVTRAVLPLLRRHQPGARIVMMSSVSGLVSYPFLGAYAASKFALEALADALRIELTPWRIHISLIEPGPIDTPIWDKALADAKAQAENWPADTRNLYPAYLEKMPALLAETKKRAVPVDAVVRVVEHALESTRPKARYPVGPGSRLARARKFIPDRLWDYLVRRELGK